jgi:uncharacterized protein (TIGR02996 family)
MTQLNDLIESCLARPADEAPRLMLTDFVDEQGNERAASVLKLSRCLLEATDNPAFDWVPPVHEDVIEFPGQPDVNDRRSVRFFQKDGVWFRRVHRPLAWFRAKRPQWAARVFASAVMRHLAPMQRQSGVVVSILYNLATICELAAAGLIDHKKRDQLIEKQKGIPNYNYFNHLIPPIFTMAAVARSGSIGGIQYTISRGTAYLYYLRMEKKKGRSKSVSDFMDFQAKECAGGPYHKSLLRMVGCLKQWPGLDL